MLNDTLANSPKKACFHYSQSPISGSLQCKCLKLTAHPSDFCPDFQFSSLIMYFNANYSDLNFIVTQIVCWYDVSTFNIDDIHLVERIRKKSVTMIGINKS